MNAVATSVAAKAEVSLPAEDPVFFMHIAKTAGSYLNAVLANAVPEGALAVHVEHWLGNTGDLEARLEQGVRIFSGHMMNGLWEEIARPLGRRFRKVTILRDPIEHLASHLLWLDHYNRADMRPSYRELDEAQQRVIDRIATVDLTDPGHLDAYLTTLGATELRLFDNCQSRYFLGAGGLGPEASRPLTIADARALRNARATFDHVLRQDRLARDLDSLGASLGLSLAASPARINASRATRRIDTESPLVRAILSKRTLLDQWLWREVGA